MMLQAYDAAYCFRYLVQITIAAFYIKVLGTNHGLHGSAIIIQFRVVSQAGWVSYRKSAALR